MAVFDVEYPATVLSPHLTTKARYTDFFNIDRQMCQGINFDRILDDLHTVIFEASDNTFILLFEIFYYTFAESN